MSSMVSEKNETERPQCILCSKVLSNVNLKPSRLKEHLDNRIIRFVMGVQSRKMI